MIEIRDMRPGDLAFVRDSWWRSWRDDVARWYRLPEPLAWLVGEATIAVVVRVLATPGVRVRVVCDSDDPDTIAAWAASHDGCGLYGFVKMPLRRNGLWRMLAADAHVTKYAIHTSRAQRWHLMDGLEFAPGALMRER